MDVYFHGDQELNPYKGDLCTIVAYRAASCPKRPCYYLMPHHQYLIVDTILQTETFQLICALRWFFRIFATDLEDQRPKTVPYLVE